LRADGPVAGNGWASFAGFASFGVMDIHKFGWRMVEATPLSSEELNEYLLDRDVFKNNPP
jgi:hypothetical protein